MKLPDFHTKKEVQSSTANSFYNMSWNSGKTSNLFNNDTLQRSLEDSKSKSLKRKTKKKHMKGIQQLMKFNDLNVSNSFSTKQTNPKKNENQIVVYKNFIRTAKSKTKQIRRGRVSKLSKLKNRTVKF